MKTVEIISYWEELKKLIARENIYADLEIQKINEYLYEKIFEEISK